MLDSTNIQRFNNYDFDVAPTYRELLEQLKLLTEEQLDYPLTIELDKTQECIPGFLDLTGENHDSLDADIPVIRVDW